jgi:stage V sporulation protein R
VGDPYGVLRYVWANFRDESFVSQFLSPAMIRSFGLFRVVDDEEEEEMEVDAIHDERGYRKIRRALSKYYDIAYRDPDIQIVDVDLAGDRRLILHHKMLDGMSLDEADTQKTLQHVADLWGYDVRLLEIDESVDETVNEIDVSPQRPFT